MHYPKSKQEGEEHRRKLTHFLGHHFDNIEMLSSLLPSSVEVGPFRTTKQFISEICNKMDKLETWMHYPKSK